jgi:hypothetical protein
MHRDRHLSFRIIFSPFVFAFACDNEPSVCISKVCTRKKENRDKGRKFPSGIWRNKDGRRSTDGFVPRAPSLSALTQFASFAIFAVKRKTGSSTLEFVYVLF